MSESRLDNLKSENSRLRDEIEKRNTSIANLAGCPTEVAVFLVALVIAGATVAGLLEPGGLQSGLLVGVLCGAFVAMLACLAVPVVAAFGWFGRRVSSPTAYALLGLCLTMLGVMFVPLLPVVLLAYPRWANKRLEEAGSNFRIDAASRIREVEEEPPTSSARAA